MLIVDHTHMTWLGRKAAKKTFFMSGSSVTSHSFSHVMTNSAKRETHERCGILIRTLVTLTFDLQRTWVVFGDVFIEPEGRKGRDLWLWMGAVRKTSVKCVLLQLEKSSHEFEILIPNVLLKKTTFEWRELFGWKVNKQPQTKFPKAPGKINLNEEMFYDSPCQYLPE